MTDLDIERIRDGLKGRTVGGNVVYFGTLDSTMDEARRLAEQGVTEGTVVIAEEQTRGRGRFDRRWISDPGQDLMLSVVLRPDGSQLPYVNMAAALSVCSTLSQVAGMDATIKWPNDVKICGSKVSGILVECTVNSRDIDYAVLGIGLNVNSNLEVTKGISSIATSMYNETSRTFNRTDVLIDLLRGLNQRYLNIRSGLSLVDEWASRLETLGKTIRVRWQDKMQDGVATGVDDQGNLLVRRPDGVMTTVVAGEVTLQH